MRLESWLISLVAALVAAAAACDGGEASGASECERAKCDTPADPELQPCEQRRREAFDGNHRSFTAGALRWSCADVPGLAPERRGEEYCELFALVEPPPTAADPAPAPWILGKHEGASGDAGESAPGAALNAEAISLLEADPAKVVGHCVFTSWNSDVPGPLPSCAQGVCPTLAGLAVDAPLFRATFAVNSAEAGHGLVDDCFVLPPAGDPEDPGDPLHDPFLRGCRWNDELRGTDYRKSDSIICAGMTRLAECGCAGAGGAGFPDLVSPSSLRGFPLGTWSGFVLGSERRSALPPSCRYLASGEDSQVLVTCDLSAADLLSRPYDVKGLCAERYAPNIVVHVPIPSGTTCDPTTSASPYRDDCGPTPWTLGEP